jgi:hypothetical protein
MSSNNHKVIGYIAAGLVENEWTYSGGRSTGLALGPEGLVYIADQEYSRVIVYRPAQP